LVKNSGMTITPTAVQRAVPILSQREVAPRHYRVKFRSAEIATQARAGQFVHVLPCGEASYDPLLRRAFSILNIEEDTFEILYRVEGRGTAQMSRWREDDFADVIGPLGNGFAALPSLRQRAILVGGGVGVPPIAMLASTKAKGQDVKALIGARSAREVLCQDDFTQHAVPISIATDDGSMGHHGFVTDLLRRELESESIATVFACGPFAMLRAVAMLCAQFNAPCQVSLEESMPCGIGVCNGCVVAVNSAGDDYGRYRRICVEGPVLWSHEIDWGQPQGSCA
jgi:dihydroorotate dehydrogenase electron transfer subunit